MKKIGVLLLAVSFALALANPGRLIDDGKFQQAYSEALAMKSAPGYALAAEAASLYAGYKAAGSKEKEEWFSKAEAAAKLAIKADPKYPKGYFELSRAQGRLAQYRGILASLNLASSVRDNIKKTLALDPTYDAAWVALAVWNLELAQKGVGWMYGASIGNVIPNFEKAIKLAPNDISHRLEYGSALLRMKKPQLAKKQLEKALQLRAVTYTDRMDQQKAKELLAQIK